MPQSGLFKRYLEQCFDRLLKSLQGYVDSGDTRLLFRFRVSIKKIRTCLTCIEFHLGKNEFQKERKQFRKMFRSGGKLREYQLYRAWFKRHHCLRLEKSIHLESHAGNKDVSFLRTAPALMKEIKAIRGSVFSRAKKMDQEEIFAFYVSVLPECLSLMKIGPSSKNEWHALRKRLKRVLYARHWQDKPGLSVLSGRQAIFLDQVQHRFGDWHDNEVFAEWIKEQQKKYFKNISKKQKEKLLPSIQRAMRTIEESRRKYEKRVNSKLKQSQRMLKPFEKRLKKV